MKTFLDIRDRVQYDDKENEEGFLGLAFHPKYKENGEFFVYYTAKPTPENPHLSVISRFRVSKDDPNRADPKSEEVIMTIKQPYWNHNGGTIVFGPDGYLYIGLGDGGLRDDPHGNGQNLERLLGKILRIDVDHKDPGLGYAIPKDNPFAGKPGRPRRNLGLRHSQRLADRVRPRDGRPVGRRRRPGHLGRDRHHHPRRQLRLEPPRSDAPVHAQGQTQSKRQPAAARSDRADLGIPPRRRQIDHRRQRLPRQASARARRRRTSTPTT